MSEKNQNFQKSTLPNGVRILTEKMTNVRSASVGVWVLSGSRNETPENNGVSHFVEHIVFKGTLTRSSNEIAESIESVGGILNAFTSREATCFYAKVMDQHQLIALEVLSDLVTSPKLDFKDIRKERKVVLEELKNCEDTPDDIIHDRFIKNVFYRSPLGFPILGPKKNVRSFSPDSVRSYLKTNYTPDRILVSASGNIEHQKIVEDSEKWLGILNGKFQANQNQIGTLRKGVFAKTAEIQQAHILMGGRCFSYDHKSRFPLLVLNTILGGGMSSRLFRTIREDKGLAYSIYSYLEKFADSGIYGIYAGTDKNKIQQCIDLIWKELKKLTVQKVSETELLKIKSQIKGSLMLSLESTSSRMMKLARMEIYSGKFETLDSTIKAIDSVTAEQVMEVANAIFTEENLSITIIKPKK